MFYPRIFIICALKKSIKRGIWLVLVTIIYDIRLGISKKILILKSHLTNKKTFAFYFFKCT